MNRVKAAASAAIANANRGRNKKMTYTAEQAQKDLNAPREAVLARWMFPDRYGGQNGGQATFWENLPESDKGIIRDCLNDLEKSPREK